MASQINASNSGFGGIVSTGDSSGVLQLQTVGTTAITVDTSQNVGIGTTSPSARLHVSASLDETARFTSSGNPYISLYSNATRRGYIQFDSTSTAFYNESAVPMLFGTNSTERMRIDSSGRVTMSAQPRFLAYRSSDQTGYNATSQGDVVITYNATTQNVGSHFSTSTGKFTAPVAGMYVFQASAWSSGGTAFTQAWLVLNGVRADYSDQSVSTTGNSIFSATFLIYLSANDTVGYHPYNGTNTNQTITANSYHTWFKGYLIS